MQVGDVVHYVSYGTPGGEYGSECRAAMVTERPVSTPENEVLGVMVANPTGVFFNRTVPYSRDTTAGGTWHHVEECPVRW